MKKIVVVCLGNICRSPMAEGILKKKITENNLPIEVDSAGTAHFHVGEAPDIRAIKTAKQFGVDISQLRGRQFTEKDFDAFDHIFVMDRSNQKDVLKLARSDDDKNKVSLFLDLTNDFKTKDVPDPWFGGDEGFVDVFKMLENAADNFVLQFVNKKA